MSTVVIADDSPTLRRIVSAVLSRAGFDVVVAMDGVQAVQAVFRTQPDAVVIDVQMPRMSGTVAARVLKDQWQTADIPVVMLTSLDGASDRYWGAQTGADLYLTKDFKAPELVIAVGEVMTAAVARRGDRPPVRPEPMELSDDDVLARVCGLLDRKLFEASVTAEVTAISTTAEGFENTVAALLGLLARFVDFDLAAVLLAQEGVAYVAVARPAAHPQYTDFLAASADGLTAATGTDCVSAALDVRIADPAGLLVADPEDLPTGAAGARMATFLSIPLRGYGGRVVGVLTVSSATKNAFGEGALTALRLVAEPAAIVVDRARLARVEPGQVGVAALVSR